MMAAIGKFFGFFMYHCYRFLQDYGLSIVLFTLITKIILLPVSILVQKNSIKMVQMYPELNRIRAKCFGNRDMISEEQYRLYKKHHYHPMLDLVPVIVQLVILMGVIDVIYQPMHYLLHMGQDAIAAALRAFHDQTGISAELSSIQIQFISFLHQESSEATLLFSRIQTMVTAEDLQAMQALDLHFCGFDLGLVPRDAKGASLLIPVLAAASSWLMCFTQNRSNVLQSEQSKTNQWTTLLLSVGLSLYLGLFVPAGVGFYWIVSNLFSIAQMYLLNFFIDPKKYIDYEELEESRSELAKMQEMASGSKKSRSKDEISREAADYKRFLAYPGKQLVFYSEKNGFYKYFKDVIEEILAHSDVVIHYITGDPDDEVFRLQSEQFQVYYIGENKLIVLMMKMDADIVVLTMPDLQKYHIRRSMVRDDIEYVYMDHAVASANLTLRKHALDAFDTIFATNERMAMEIRAMEKVYDLPKKNILKYGYSLIDNMITAYSAEPKEDTIVPQPKILIAPSWQEDNLMDSCIEDLLDRLGGGSYQITVRPHPQYVRHFEEKLKLLAKKYEKDPCIELQLDFSSNKTVFDADVLITDWSGIAYEYAFTTLKPVLFINTPMKVMNPDYREIDVVPFDIEARDQVGISVDTDALHTLPDVVHRLLTEEIYSKEALKKVREKYLYHVGSSAETGAKYLLRKLSILYEKETDIENAADTSSESEARPSWRSRFAGSSLILAFPLIMVWILGPLEIYAGNMGELFFGTGDFFWMFLGASLAVIAAGALFLSLLPEKLRHILHTLIFSASLMGYIQNLFLNRELIKTDGSKVDWSLYKEHSTHTLILWCCVIAAILAFSLFSMVRKKLPDPFDKLFCRKSCEKLLYGASAFFVLIQLVASFSLLFTNPYRVTEDKMYALSNRQEFCVAPGNNIIVLILDRYGNKTYDNMVDDYPGTDSVLKDFTYYANANSKYNYTFPSIPYMLTLVDPDCTITTNEYKERAWKEGRSSEFHRLLEKNGYSYHLYTGSGSAVYRDPSYLRGSIDNVEELDDVSYVINHGYMFYILTKTSLLKYAPYPLKPYLEIQSFYFDGIVSFDGMEACISDNEEYYRILKEQGLSVDESMKNALIITHLNGIHNPLTNDENMNPVPADSVSVMQVQLGLNLLLEEYLQQLKTLGVYDDSTIIITADHGQYLDTLDLQPIYFIKPAGQRQEAMSRTDAPISSEDFLPTVLSLIGEDYSTFGTSIFDWQEGDHRYRRTCYPRHGFDVYIYDGNRNSLSYLVEGLHCTHILATEDWD